eukprot:Rmarinus@m.26048
MELDSDPLATRSPRIVFDPRSFKYNNRCMAVFMPCLAVLLAVGGRVIFSTGVLGMLIAQTFQRSKLPEAAISCTWITVLVTICEILYFCINLPTRAYITICVFIFLVFLVVMIGLTVSLNSLWFLENATLIAMIGENFLFRFLPYLSSILVAWGFSHFVQEEMTPIIYGATFGFATAMVGGPMESSVAQHREIEVDQDGNYSFKTPSDDVDPVYVRSTGEGRTLLTLNLVLPIVFSLCVSRYDLSGYTLLMSVTSGALALFVSHTLSSSRADLSIVSHYGSELRRRDADGNTSRHAMAVIAQVISYALVFMGFLVTVLPSIKHFVVAYSPLPAGFALAIVCADAYFIAFFLALPHFHGQLSRLLEGDANYLSVALSIVSASGSFAVGVPLWAVALLAFAAAQFGKFYINVNENPKLVRPFSLAALGLYCLLTVYAAYAVFVPLLGAAVCVSLVLTCCLAACCLAGTVVSLGDILDTPRATIGLGATMATSHTAADDASLAGGVIRDAKKPQARMPEWRVSARLRVGLLMELTGVFVALAELQLRQLGDNYYPSFFVVATTVTGLVLESRLQKFGDSIGLLGSPSWVAKLVLLSWPSPTEYAFCLGCCVMASALVSSSALGEAAVHVLHSDPGTVSAYVGVGGLVVSGVSVLCFALGVSHLASPRDVAVAAPPALLVSAVLAGLTLAKIPRLRPVGVVVIALGVSALVLPADLASIIAIASVVGYLLYTQSFPRTLPSVLFLSLAVSVPLHAALAPTDAPPAIRPLTRLLYSGVLYGMLVCGSAAAMRVAFPPPKPNKSLIVLIGGLSLLYVVAEAVVWGIGAGSFLQAFSRALLQVRAQHSDAAVSLSGTSPTNFAAWGDGAGLRHSCAVVAVCILIALAAKMRLAYAHKEDAGAIHLWTRVANTSTITGFIVACRMAFGVLHLGIGSLIFIAPFLVLVSKPPPAAHLRKLPFISLTRYSPCVQGLFLTSVLVLFLRLVPLVTRVPLALPPSARESLRASAIAAVGLGNDADADADLAVVLVREVIAIVCLLPSVFLINKYFTSFLPVPEQQWFTLGPLALLAIAVASSRATCVLGGGVLLLSGLAVIMGRYTAQYAQTYI